MPETVNFGNKEPGGVVSAAMGPACGHGAADCLAPYSSLSQDTMVYVDADSQPVAGTLTFTLDADFDTGMAENYVNALSAAAKVVGAQFKETKKWTIYNSDPNCVKYGTCAPISDSDTFYVGPKYLKIERFESTAADDADPLDWMQFTVALEKHDDEESIWCTLDKLAGAITGAGSGVASAFFGIVSILSC